MTNLVNSWLSAANRLPAGTRASRAWLTGRGITQRAPEASDGRDRIGEQTGSPEIGSGELSESPELGSGEQTGSPGIGVSDQRAAAGGVIDRLRGEGLPPLMCWPGDEAQLELLVYRQLYGPSRTVQRLDSGDPHRRAVSPQAAVMRTPQPFSATTRRSAATPRPFSATPRRSAGTPQPFSAGPDRAPTGTAEQTQVPVPVPRADDRRSAGQPYGRRVPSRFRRVPSIAGLLNDRDRPRS